MVQCIDYITLHSNAITLLLRKLIDWLESETVNWSVQVYICECL